MKHPEPHAGREARDDDDTLPSRLPRPPGEEEALERAWLPPRGWWRKVSAVNNTIVGLFYIGTAMLMFVLAGLLALAIRAQLAVPENTLLSAGTYNQVFTMHGSIMMFLFAVPIVEAVAVYLLPGMLGARDLPFPRLSAYAFWAYAIGAVAFFLTIFFGVAPDGGWFMYPPLTSMEHSPGLNADFWLLGIGFIEISAIAGAIELIVGILLTRPPGMTLARMPIYAWAMLVVGVMIVFAFPALIAGTMLLEMERAFDWPFFLAERGGDPVLWQHLFWFFGHPEVYIIFLPAAGLVSMMVPALARTPLVGHRAVVVALVAVGFFSFALWAHHMFSAGLSPLALSFVSAASLAVAIPSGIQVFAWIATLWRGEVQMKAPTLFILGFLFIFVLGGLTGVMVAVIPFDWQVHDSYFVVAHLHYVLIGGMVFPIFAALYFWMPLVKGRPMSEGFARWVFGLMFVGFNVAFFPMHILGLEGMPRRVYSYDADLGWNLWNAVATVGAFTFAAGVACFFLDLVRTQRRSSQPVGNPWQAGTLEWLKGGNYGVRSIPQVDSREPLWSRPSLVEEVAAGRHWLPPTTSGGRETLVTSPLDAQPWYVLRLPGYGWAPVIAAAGTAAFFLLLTVKLVIPAFVGGVVAIAAVLHWMWQSDPAPHAPLVRVADRVPPGMSAGQAPQQGGVWLPVGGSGRRSHVWWAMVILLLVDATIFASMAFAHVHLSMRSEVCPPPGAALPAARWPLAAAGLLLAGSLLAALARRSVHAGGARRQRLLQLLLAAAFGCVALAWGADLLGHLQAGLEPRARAWDATIASMLGYQGFHVGVLLMMAGFTLARSFAGRLAPDRRAAMDATAMMWHYVTLQGLVIAALVQFLPLVMD
ncbi:cytochrome c oxidase subunit I [Caldimonas tepidiphila]|uniref:cytochrome c oxidase subunit I n=1 Tax=Caldimonas tepidiphila TaxID=2315841 RepID=UPI001F0C1F21|nr:cytochrome c oxidase subunit I [Caldimonas tepidiphila]